MSVGLPALPMLLHGATHAWRAPVLALAGALLARLAGRSVPRLSAPLAGALVGWLALIWPHAGLLSFAALHGAAPAMRLPVAGAIVLAACWFSGGRLAAVAPAVAGALAGWWLAGAPASLPGLVHEWPAVAAGGIVLWLGARLLAAAGAWEAGCAGLGLWAALSLLGVPAPYPMAALVGAAAALALIRADVAPLGLAAASLLPALAAALAHRGPGLPLAPEGAGALRDLAALVPLAVLVLAPRLPSRLSRAVPLLAGLAAATLSVAVVLLAGRVLRG